MAKNPLHQLKDCGQSIWLDNLSRPLLRDGDLQRLIRDDGVSGITSNPAIFKEAMTSSDAYDDLLAELARDGKSTVDIYEALAIRDIRNAADMLRPVHDETDGADGFVSLEVSPHLARDTAGSIDEARRLWEAVDRPNLMIKIPGTEEGAPAIEECLAAGVNINVTLLFSLEAHRRVIEAYFRALERRRDAGQPVDRIASVASFFLSRIDTKVDDTLEAQGGDTARALRGEAAVANAKLAYGMWKEMHAGDRWQKLVEAGARPQRPLWASTSTKNPDYSDVKYVEPLIGPQTVNTLPESTLTAFRDHGQAAVTIQNGLDRARQVMRELAAAGIDMDRITAELVDEGIDKFVKPFDSLLKTLDEKRTAATDG